MIELIIPHDKSKLPIPDLTNTGRYRTVGGKNATTQIPFRPNPPNPLGRHPFNILTKETIK